MARDRTYGQYCGLAKALDLVGERWGLLVVRELLLGPKRFTDLLDGLPGVSTNVLATRLRQLERAGVVERAQLPPPAASSVYELTEYGRELEPAVAALGRWGAASLGPRGDQALRSYWLALALKAFFHPEAAAELSREYEVRLSDGSFRLALSDGTLQVVAGRDGADADLVLESDDDTLVAVLSGRLDASALTLVEGDDSELPRFVELFRFA